MQRARFTVPLKKKKIVAYLWARQFFKPELNGERETYRATSPTVTFVFAKMCQINIDKINLGNDQCQYSSSFYIDVLNINNIHIINNIHGISIIYMEYQ